MRVGKAVHCCGMGSAGCRQDILIKRRGSARAHDDSSANGAGHSRIGNLSSQLLSSSKDLRPRALVGKCAGALAGARASQSSYAYIGVSQLIDGEQEEQVAYQGAVYKAESTGNTQALQELQRIAPYPSPESDLLKGRLQKNGRGCCSVLLQTVPPLSIRSES